MFILQCLLWVGILDWIGRDSERLGLRHRFWCTLLAAVGAAGMGLIILVHIAFVFTSILGLIAVLAIYVWKRNLSLPPEQQVLTRAHLDYVARRIYERLHLRGSSGRGDPVAFRP